MIDSIPVEVFGKIALLLSQEDKISLTYVSRHIYDRTIPYLYGNLFLNEKPYYPSDLDNSLGTSCWSVLYFSSVYDNNTAKLIARDKFALLVRSLQESPSKLCPLVKRVHCSWHLEYATLIELTRLLIAHGVNLQYFENFLDQNLSHLLASKGKQLFSLDITPPSILPAGPANNTYYGKMEVLLSQYNWDNIKSLTLHVNACTFFPHLQVPLKIRSLCLNLRPDTYDGTFLEQPYYKIFDTETLEELEVLSWYNAEETNLNLYELWNLHHFWEFHNIKELTILSLFENSAYLEKCFMSFSHLERIKIDYMFDIPFDPSIIEIMARSSSSETLKYIDVKFEELDPPLISVIQDEISLFNINLSCKCQVCSDTFHQVIVEKYFPTTDSLTIRHFQDIETRNFILQMFKLYPILPYTHYVDRYPAIGYNCKSLEDHASRINMLLGYNQRTKRRAITAKDIQRLYHAQIHSLKKSFNFFLQKFPNLQFLTLNDLPTKIIQVDDQQRCNFPIFYSKGYESNQIYQLVNDESLFD